VGGNHWKIGISLLFSVSYVDGLLSHRRCKYLMRTSNSKTIVYIIQSIHISRKIFRFMHNKYIHSDCQTTDKGTFIVNVTSTTEQVVKPQSHKSWFFLCCPVGVITYEGITEQSTEWNLWTRLHSYTTWTLTQRDTIGHQLSYNEYTV